MKNGHHAKKLRLNKETLRTLDASQLNGVAGGTWSAVVKCSANTNCFALCFSDAACPTGKCPTIATQVATVHATTDDGTSK